MCGCDNVDDLIAQANRAIPASINLTYRATFDDSDMKDPFAYSLPSFQHHSYVDGDHQRSMSMMVKYYTLFGGASLLPELLTICFPSNWGSEL